MLAMKAIPNVESKSFTPGVLFVAVCKLALMNGVKYIVSNDDAQAPSAAVTGTKTKQL